MAEQVDLSIVMERFLGDPLISYYSIMIGVYFAMICVR